MRAAFSRRRRSASVLPALAFLMCLCSCAIADKGPEQQTRLYMFDRCVASAAPEAPASIAAVASIFMPKLLDAGATALGNWLEALGKEKTQSASSSQRADLYVV